MKNALIFTLTVIFLASLTIHYTTVSSEARGFNRKTTRTGPAGRTATSQTNWSREGNTFNRQTTHTGPGGQTVTRHTSSTYDPATQTWNKQVQTTGPNGQTVNKSVSAQKTENGYQRQATTTGPDGQTVTRQTEAYYDPAIQTWIKTVETSK